MKTSRRAKRMKRAHRKQARAGLNMVSLMDIFTILVFFLLVNSSNVEQLPDSKSIRLPEARSEQLPRETLVIMVSRNDIIVQGRKVAEVNAGLIDGDGFIPPLKAELEYQFNRQRVSASESSEDREVTVMADESVPFKLIKRVMLTASDSRYGNVSLAVLRKEEKAG